MGKILERYVLREVVTTWLVVTGVLLIILLANQVVGVLGRAASAQFPQSVVLELIWLGSLQNLSILLPVGLLLGVVLAFGRLYDDSEMAAALACGAGPVNLYLPVALLAVVAAAALAWLTLGLAPHATEQALSLRNEAMRAGQFAPIAPGKFRTFGSGNAVVYAQGVNPDGTLHNVFVERSDGPLVQVVLAERAQSCRDRGRHDTHSYTVRRAALRGRAGQRRVPHRALRRARDSGAGPGGRRCRA